MDEMGDTKRERKIGAILCQLEDLDCSSSEVSSSLQQFTERLFGHVYDIESKNQKELRPAEEINICETVSYRLMHIARTIAGISLEIDSMMKELPQRPKTEPEEEF